MRSPSELWFRLRQETTNVFLCCFPPGAAGAPPAPLAGLPDPGLSIERLRGAAFAAQVERLAERILDRRFPLLGLEVRLSPEIRWRRDPLRGVETPPRYFRRIPYLDCRRAGDHKFIWELNRHQHLVLLAQAYRFSGRAEILNELQREVESWMEQNPFQRGINWTSALEVGFRALSWVWVFHLVGAELPGQFRERFLAVLYRHGRHLEHNLSRYFSRNTHLIGEAVALHALGVLFPAFPRAARWARTGAATLRRELAYQVQADGSHFEHSSYYHLYALDFFLLHYLLSGRPPAYRPVLLRMAEYLDALMGPSRVLPLMGDDDGGRVFHPYGTPAEFGRATLATCALLLGREDWEFVEEDLHPQAVWWLGEEAWRVAPRTGRAAGCSHRFTDAGVAVMRDGPFQVIVDAGPFGTGRGGHSHSDTLSIIARYGAEELLADVGTFTYVGEPAWRDWFRGAAAHNTVRVNGRDQGDAAGLFAWRTKPAVQIREWGTTRPYDFLDAECRYGSILHRRRVLLLKPDLLWVLDDLEGAGSMALEQFWHPGEEVTRLAENVYQIGSCARLVFPATALVACGRGGQHGWRSRAFGHRGPAPFLCVSLHGAVPATLGAVLALRRSDAPASLALRVEGSNRWLRYESEGAVEVRFAKGGPPDIIKS